ncbi:MAG: hypothetical protein J7M26_08620, partial [Armatimonadetes bacterium]|nr:hypothetical protein [Armatimonadota bacterium]
MLISLFRRVSFSLLLAMATVALLISCSSMADAAQLLADFESTQGLKLTWGSAMQGHLEIITQPPFVTHGQSALRLWGEVKPDAKGNSYLGVRISLPAPVDLRKHVILFDAASSTPEHTGALYLRAYDSQGRCAVSFSNWSKPLTTRPRTFELFPGLSRQGFTWEAKRLDEGADRSAVVAIEFIIGTRDKGLVVDAYVDNLRIEATKMQSWDEVTKPKPLVRETPLVKKSRPAAVVLCPPGDEWAAAAQAFVRAVADATGVKLPVQTVPAVPELLKQGKLPLQGAKTHPDLDPTLWGGAPARLGDQAVTSVVIGNVADTAALLYLYGRKVSAADHFYPGAGGYEVRTVHDPWGLGINSLVIGATDAAGAEAGIKALTALLEKGAKRGELVLPHLLLVKLTGKAQELYGGQIEKDPGPDLLKHEQAYAERALQRGAHTGLFSRIASVGESYMRSGHSAYAQAFVWLVQRALQHYETKPKTYGGPWGMDSDFMVHRVIPAWDVVEEDPSLTDEQRWEVTRILHKWVSEVAVRPASSTVGNERPRFNHQTFPALGLMYAGDYFSKYYHTWDADHWLSIADECFNVQAKMFKPHEDCNGYQWLTLTHLATYCLARPAFAYFMPSRVWPQQDDSDTPRLAHWQEVSNARRDADYAILSADSFGYSTTYGDTGNFRGWWSELNFLHLVNFVLRDPAYEWMIERKIAKSGRRSWGLYSVDLAAKEPDYLLGLRVFPLEARWWQAF